MSLLHEGVEAVLVKQAIPALVKGVAAAHRKRGARHPNLFLLFRLLASSHGHVDII
jgi:hypothetical protein